MDDSANLSLNLIPDNVLTIPRFNFKKETKPVHGDRRARVKQRKEARQQKEQTRKSENGTSLGKRSQAEESAERIQGSETSQNHNRSDAHRGEAAKKGKNGAIIASLFRKNPEVPVIPNTEVETVQENVFTGDTFKELPLHPFLISNLEEKQGFKQLTEVQKRTIPFLLRGKDALVKSQTGSGKTLAYAVPVVQTLRSRVVKIRRDDGPYALVIVPTRELALQSLDLFQKLLQSCVWIVPGCLMGGEKKKAEKSRLRKGINILVATPGRLMDHIKTTGVLSLHRVRWLVIDEADRLLELGYEKDIAEIINALRAQCPDPPQTVLLSATLSQGVERLSSITLHEPEHINVSEDPTSHQLLSKTDGPDQSSGSHKVEGSNTEKFSLPSQLSQHFVVTPCKQRLVTLAALILWKCKYTDPRSKMIVFMSTTDSVEFHARLLTQVLGSKRSIENKLTKLASGKKSFEDSDDDDNDDDEVDIGSSSAEEEDEDVGKGGGGSGLRMFKLHGDMNQKDRSQTFHDFTHTEAGVLLCTDVASRGLDLPHVDWIVQYTSPGATVDYIHRVGRTARAGSRGHALLFLMPAETGFLNQLNARSISLTQFDQSSILKVLLQNISDLPKPDSDTSGLQTPRTQEEAATYLQDRFEECVLNKNNMQGLAAKGFQSYIRAYATYSSEVKDSFRVRDLHLGHVAKSFGLRSAPAQIHGVASKLGIKTGGGNKYKAQDKERRPEKRPLSFKQAALSESSSGFGQQQSKKSKVMAKPGGKWKPKVKRLGKK